MRTPEVVKWIRILMREEVSEPLTRRRFLHKVPGLVAGAQGLAVLPNQPPKTKLTPRIAIIGAGLAGLSAAYHLQKSGYPATIYEAQERIGGRVMSANDLLAPGITTELGGEFIDSNHGDLLTFCKEFQLPLLDLKSASEAKFVETDYFFSGTRISEETIIREIKPYLPRLREDSHKIVKDQVFRVQQDKMSIDAYLEGIGVTGWLFELLTTSFTSELGIESAEQSSLSFLTVLTTDVSNGFKIYGDSDERFKVEGGNQRIVTALSKQMRADLNTGYFLTRIEQSASGYKVSFDNGRVERVDVLILTLPFSVLRNVELKIEMSDKKRACIQQLAYGLQSKLLIGVDQRPWRAQGFSGYVLSSGVHNGWDHSQMQQHNRGAGGYTLFLGGEKGKNLSLNHYDGYLRELDAIYPGVALAANGRKSYFNWSQNRMTRGTYACYRTGQATSIGGLESQPIGNLYFAGEHCSRNFQGFMNGAAESGRLVAHDIVHKMRKGR